MKKRLAFVLVLLILATTFVGCGQKQDAQTDPNGESEKASEQKLVYAMGNEPREMDPTLNVYLDPSNVLQNLFRGLYKLDENGEAVPSMAESHTVDETGTVYTFKMNPNAKWNDGEPLNAYDFEYSWKRVLDPEVASGASYALFSIKNARACVNGTATLEDVGIKALDENTFEVTLESPTPWFIDLTTTPNFFPVRKDVVEAGSWTTNPETYICNGPFMLTEIKPKEKYTLTKNPHYLDTDKVKLDTVEILFIDSPESTLIAYNNDEVHFTENISDEAKEQYYGTDEFAASKKIGLCFFDFNTKQPPFDNPKVRRAFTISINRQEIMDNIVETPELPACEYVPYGYYNSADKTQEFREAVGSNLFKEDVEEAKQLLAEAGYPNGEGFPTVKLMVNTSQVDKDIAQVLQNMWKENLGVPVEIQTFEPKIYWDELHLGKFSIAKDGWTGLYPDPMSIFQPHTTDECAQNTRWSNAEYDELLNKTIEEVDQQKRFEMFKRMEEILIEELPVMPLYHRMNMYLCKPYAKGVIKNTIAHTNLEYAYIEE